MDEAWKDIPGWEKRYEISSHGRVRNKDTGYVLATAPVTTGHRIVCLYDNPRQTTKHVHTLVANLFVPRPSAQHVRIRHKDKDYANNRADNLEWVLRGGHKKPQRGNLTETEIARIRTMLSWGIPQAKIAPCFGTSQTNVSRIAQGIPHSQQKEE